MGSNVSNIFITRSVTLITLANIPCNTSLIANIFNELKTSNINIDMVSQSTPLKGTINLSFTIDDDELFNSLNTLKTFNRKIKNLRIEVNSNNTKISFFGEDMRNTPGVFAETLTLLSKYDLEIKMITTSEIDISYLLYSIDEQNTINIIKNHYNIV